MASSFQSRHNKYRYTDELVDQMDYKNLDLIKRHVLESGRILPSRITGAPAKFQRRLSQSVKLARFLALIPYCDAHRN